MNCRRMSDRPPQRREVLALELPSGELFGAVTAGTRWRLTASQPFGDATNLLFWSGGGEVPRERRVRMAVRPPGASGVFNGCRAFSLLPRVFSDDCAAVRTAFRQTCTYLQLAAPSRDL